MTRRKLDFGEDVRFRALLWCARHCCLCGKACGIAIEVAHIDPLGGAGADNAIPLCFDCHAAVGHYNEGHPRGRIYPPAELRAQRERIYEQHTQHLVPPMHYALSQNNPARILPDIGFQITHLGDLHPVRVRLTVTLAQGERNYGCPEDSRHYDGSYLWNLNPRFRVLGHFMAPKETLLGSAGPLRARVDVGVIDIYEREHTLLPMGYVNLLDGSDWYLEPAEAEMPKRKVSRILRQGGSEKIRT